MVDVTLRLVVLDEKGLYNLRDRWLSRSVQLPFAPFAGLVISSKNLDVSDWDRPIKEVVFYPETQEIECWLEHIVGGDDVDKIVALLQSDGWNVVKNSS